MAQMQLAGIGAGIFKDLEIIELAVILSGYILLPATSGWIVTRVLNRISGSAMQKASREVRDTGYVIGKCENLLLLTFMLLDAFTAMALIFTAKAIVRAEDNEKASSLLSGRNHDQCDLFGGVRAYDQGYSDQDLRGFYAS